MRFLDPDNDYLCRLSKLLVCPKWNHEGSSLPGLQGGLEMFKATRITALGILITATGLVACGKQGTTPIAERERRQAPKEMNDVGILVEGASTEEIETILFSNPHAQVRVLDSNHGLYEIFNVNQEDVSAATTGAVSVNSYFKREPAAAPAQTLKEMLSVPAPAGLTLPGLNPCRVGSRPPTAVLEVTAPTTPLNGETFDIGQKISFNGKGSKSADGSQLKMLLAIVGPEMSEFREVLQPIDKFEFTTDALGSYQVVVVVQDKNDFCALDGAAFLISSNPKFIGAKTTEPKLDVSKFTHLASVSAKESWKLSEGKNVTIAIIDSGVNYNHALLAPNIAVNAREIAGNGKDDDKNGFVDDVTGYDIVNGDAFPYDDDSHGTHVAGLAAGRQFGMARQARILPVKVMTALGGDVGTVAAGIRYAVDQGVQIINLSLGAPSALPHPAIVSAVNYAESKNVLLVIACGNGDPTTGLGFSIDEINIFPAGLPNNNIVSVAAFDRFNVLSPYSNFGAKGVDVVAPGGFLPNDPMFSTAFQNPKDIQFIGLNGTSMAAPVVSGIAAQVLSLQPGLSVQRLREVLINAGTEKKDLVSVTVSGRHIDALSALQTAQVMTALF